MNNLTRALAILVLVFGFFNHIQAQDSNTDAHTLTISVPEVALLDIETSGASTTIALNPAAPTEAGLGLDFSSTSDNSLYLNYSSTVGTSPADTERKVSVAATGTLISGATLKVQAAADAGNGAGTMGSPVASPVTIAALATSYDVITGIGSSYTGNGANNGHNLTYTLTEDASNYGSLNFSTNYSLTLTYTLSDN